MIYYVEDDQGIRELVLYTLQNTGFEATGFSQSSHFFKALEEKGPTLVLLDIMLPDEDGIAILKKLKSDSKTKDIPVIMLTAKALEYDKVIGLDLGADDYISKPFGMMELVSRVKAVLRRTQNDQPKVLPTEYIFENVLLDTKKHIVKVDNEIIDLTLKEFELLLLLLKNTGMVLKRDVILQNIWSYDFDGETRTVDVHIRTLRSKLKTGGNIIKTVRGVGYRIGGII
ncbi:MAG: response regulator transcription factor [Oscillospiraceae bacterium]